ncbi:MAG: hypothetical protein N3A38_02935 [Planctomycetota bacterium]|nr:hypothetical protein [Planctomycetota bacterium]
MKYLLGAGKGIVFFVVTYLFAYGAATLYAQPYQATFIGWASYKGQTLLLKPGIIAAIKYKGEEFLLNAPANAVMKFEMGVSLALVALVGATAGQPRAGRRRPAVGVSRG